MSKTTSVTLDRLAQAKSALAYAMRAAECELTRAETKQLDVIIGKVEALQNKIRPRAT